MKMKTVSQIAFKDISKYLKKKYGKKCRSGNIITPNQLETKENRRLNRELGLSGINK